jgi:hypothetical protein
MVAQVALNQVEPLRLVQVELAVIMVGQVMKQYLVVLEHLVLVAVVQVILEVLPLAVAVAHLKLDCHWPQQVQMVALKFG